MPAFIDQTGRTVSIHSAPQRIISLVPSQTELLFDLGLSNEVIGITRFCIHPEEWFHTKTRVGGTKELKMDRINQLHPDLIIANKEENVKEQIEELQQKYPVWVSDVNNLDDAFKMIEQIGRITNRENEAIEVIKGIKENFLRVEVPERKPRGAYLIWKEPYMTVGRDTFIHSMLQVAGMENIFHNSLRYPEVQISALKKLNCELLLLSSEPFPFKQKHIDELQIHLPDTKIILVDGEMFSWYGSRLLQAPLYFNSLQSAINKRS